MGFLDNKRRQAHAKSMNWDMMAGVMLHGYELGMAEEEGIEDLDQQGDRALEVRDSVLDEIGYDHFVQALIDADYEMSTSNKDAVIEHAVQTSGYRSARKRLFPS